MKRYQLGILAFLLLALLTTLFPPFEWGNERLRTQRDRQATVQITATLAGELTPYGTTAERVFPIEKRGFVLGSPWKKVQIGWGWEWTVEARKSYWERKSFYDSIVGQFEKSPICQWVANRPFEHVMARPLPQNRKANDYFYRAASLPYLGEGFSPPNTKPFYDRVQAEREEYFQFRPTAIIWLNNFRRTHPAYYTMSDSDLCERIVYKTPPRLLIDDFFNNMDDDTLRTTSLLFFSELGLVSKDSLRNLNTLLAPPSSGIKGGYKWTVGLYEGRVHKLNLVSLPNEEYYSPKVYDYLHRELNVAALSLNYLIAFLLAAMLELGKHFFAALRQKRVLKES